MHQPIELWFLILSLIFPRLSLLGAYIWGGMPAHTGVPFWLCFLGSIFFARVLVCVFIAMNMGVESPWFIAHAIFCILGYIFGSIKISTRNSKD